MKNLRTSILTLILIALFSCGGNEKKTNQQLTGTIYQSSDGMDSDCKIIIKPTDFYQNILFLNDSVFVKIINTCCGEPDDTVDFASEFFYKGVYKMDDKKLTLTFNPKVAILFVKVNKNLSKEDNSPTYVKIEISDLKSQILDRLNCKENPYFKMTDGEFNNELISPIEKSIESFKTNLEEKGVWQIINDKL